MNSAEAVVEWVKEKFRESGVERKQEGFMYEGTVGVFKVDFRWTGYYQGDPVLEAKKKYCHVIVQVKERVGNKKMLAMKREFYRYLQEREEYLGVPANMAIKNQNRWVNSAGIVLDYKRGGGFVFKDNITMYGGPLAYLKVIGKYGKEYIFYSIRAFEPADRKDDVCRIEQTIAHTGKGEGWTPQLTKVLEHRYKELEKGLEIILKHI